MQNDRVQEACGDPLPRTRERVRRRLAIDGTTMAKSFWSGAISFGLVEIPVRLHPVRAPEELSFTLLDKKDLSPVGYRRFNKESGKEVPWDQIVRGYEYEKDQYVVVTDADLERANVDATHSIAMLSFVPAAAIDPVYFETPYYIEPTARGGKSYSLLREALARVGRVGIARVVLRTRSHLAAVVVWDQALVLVIMRYEHELRKPRDLEIPAPGSRATKVSAQELQMAERLIDDMSEKTWDPKSFHDEYRDDVLELIHQKIKSGKTHAITERKGEREYQPRGTSVVDLMPLLKKSLASRAKKSREPKRAHPRVPAERRRRRARSA